jgi:hypothetical protein
MLCSMQCKYAGRVEALSRHGLICVTMYAWQQSPAHASLLRARVAQTLWIIRHQLHPRHRIKHELCVCVCACVTSGGTQHQSNPRYVGDSGLVRNIGPAGKLLQMCQVSQLYLPPHKHAALDAALSLCPSLPTVGALPEDGHFRFRLHIKAREDRTRLFRFVAGTGARPGPPLPWVASSWIRGASNRSSQLRGECPSSKAVKDR